MLLIRKRRHCLKDGSKFVRSSFAVFLLMFFISFKLIWRKNGKINEWRTSIIKLSTNICFN